MIPASVEHGVPSAGDDSILADILQSLGRDPEPVIAVLRTLDAMAGGPFADLDLQRRNAVAAQLREIGGEGLTYPVSDTFSNATRRAIPARSSSRRQRLLRRLPRKLRGWGAGRTPRDVGPARRRPTVTSKSKLRCS
jgi:hypothetical protein